MLATTNNVAHTSARPGRLSQMRRRVRIDRTIKAAEQTDSRNQPVRNWISLARSQKNNAANVSRPSVMPSFRTPDIVPQQHDVGRFASDIDSGIDRDANVGRVQCRRVVDAVTEIADHMPRLFPCEDDPLFLIRFDLRKDIDIGNSLHERFVAEQTQLRTGQQDCVVQAHLPRNLGGHEHVVAGNHLQTHAEVLQFANRFRDAGLRRIVQHEEADECHLRLVGFAEAGVRHRTTMPRRASPSTRRPCSLNE